MNLSDFNNISMNGRMAFLILCTEKYLNAKFPDKDWSRLSAWMWQVTNEYWDEWDEKFMEIIPEYLFEANSYDNSDFDHLSETDYNYFSKLSDNMPDDYNQLLLNLHKLVEIYSYSSIPGYGDEASQILLNECAILERNNIAPPDIKIVSFSSFNEKNGWGNNFDGTKLSLVLNK